MCEYSGDIKGTYYAQDLADRFGVTGVAPRILDYYFTKDDIPKVIDAIDNILWNFWVYGGVEKMRTGMTNEEISVALGVPIQYASYYRKEFIDYEIGMKILKTLQEKGVCHFKTECT